MPFSANLQVGTNVNTLEVMTELYLMCPDTVKKETDIFLVKKNLVLCFDLWEKSVVFEYDAFQVRVREGKITVAKHIL